MVTLQLTEDERAELMNIVRRYEAALHVEIAHTDHRDLRVALRLRADIVEKILAKVRDAA